MLENAPILVTCVRCQRLHVPADLAVANPCCPACRTRARRAAAKRPPGQTDPSDRD